MQVLTVADLSTRESLRALHAFRHHPSQLPSRKALQAQIDEDQQSGVYHEVLQYTGGRLSYLSRVARSQDMRQTAERMLRLEKGWLLGQIGLIPDCDDDVMDEVRLPLFLSFFFFVIRYTHRQWFLCWCLYFSKNGARAPGCFFKNS